MSRRTRASEVRRHTGVAVIALVLTVVPARAQQAAGSEPATLTGMVTVVDHGEPLGGVEVLLRPGGRRTHTDSSGRFTFTGLPAGEYVATFRLTSHAGTERPVLLRPGEEERLEIGLEVSAILLDEIQVTATRGRRAVTEVAAPVSVVDREDLERRQASKVGELLAAEPGVEVEGSGPFLGLPVIRGLSGNRVLVLVDGQRLNNAREAINFGGVQPSLLDVEQIEEVEILRGPASVLYGTDALGGIVNIITREAPFPSAGLAFGGHVETGYGSIDEGRRVSGSLRASAPRFGVRVAGAWREADDFESPEAVVVNSAAESLDLSADIEFRPSAAHRLTLGLDRFEAEDVGLPGTAGVFTGSFPFTDREKASLTYSTTAVPAIGDLRVETYVQDQDENFATVLDLPPIEAGPSTLFIDSETERVSDVVTVGANIRAEKAVGIRHRLTYGIDFFRDDVDEERREETVTVSEPRFPGGPPAGTETEVDDAPTTPEAIFQGLGFYLQDEIEAGRWRLVPGVRFDRFDIDTERLDRPEGAVPAQDRTEEAVSASVGVLFHATPRIRPVVSVGRAFRTPNIIERFFFGPGSQGGLTVPSPDLENETSLNVDAGIRLAFPRVRAMATYFHNRIDDFITFVPGTFEGDSTFAGQPISQVANVGEVRLQGVEASLEYLIPVGGTELFASAAFSYTDGEDLETDQPLFVPPVKGVFGLRWRGAADALTAGIGVRTVGDRDEVPAGFEATRGFTVVDLYGALHLLPWVGHDATLRLGLDNATDEPYREPFNTNLAPGRSFEASVRVGF